MRDSRIVDVYLGNDKRFTVEVTGWSCRGDYYTPADGGYDVDSEVYDEDDNNVTELIERWERIYKQNFNALAIDNFND